MKYNFLNIKLIKYSFIGLIILLTFFIFPITASAQWVKITNLPPQFLKTYWLEVIFLKSDPNYGWCCGFEGSILRTTDAGLSWDGTRIESVNQLESINFVDKNNGYTSGEGKIYKSEDGGISWVDVSPKFATNTLFWGNSFVNKDVGILIGGGCDTFDEGIDPQVFLRTEDGGKTWTRAVYHVKGTALTDCLLIDPEGEGYATSSGRLWQTLDGGRNWQIFSNCGNEDWQEELCKFGNSFLVPYSVGCGGGYTKGGLRFSTDFGITWKDTSLNKPMYGAYLIDSLHGWGGGYDHNVLYTSDGGQNWNIRFCGIEQNIDLDDIYFINDTTGWVVGDGGIYKYKPIENLNPQITSDKGFRICVGDTLELKTTKQYSNYNWSTGETTSSIKVTKAGKYKITVSDFDCYNETSESIIVSYFPEPKPFIYVNNQKVESIKFCIGDTIVLTVNNDFKSYLWFDNSTNTFTNVVKPGEYNVKVWDSNGCSATKLINVMENPNPKPTITADRRKKVCIGDTFFLATNSGYKSYQWYKKNQNDSLVSNEQSFTAIESGTYYVNTFTDLGCHNKSDEIYVYLFIDSNRYVFNMPNPSDIVFTLDSTYFKDYSCSKLLLKNTSNIAYTINDVFLLKNIEFSIPQSQFPILINPFDSSSITICYYPSALGLQRDTLILPDVCRDHILPLKAVGIPFDIDGNANCGIILKLTTKSLTKPIIKISPPLPNPVLNGTFKINFSAQSPNEISSNAEIEILNLLGETVNKQYFNISLQKDELLSNQININIIGLLQGYYLFKFKFEDNIFIYPLIVNFE